MLKKRLSSRNSAKGQNAEEAAADKAAPGQTFSGRGVTVQWLVDFRAKLQRSELAADVVPPAAPSPDRLVGKAGTLRGGETGASPAPIHI